ncbi:MAG: GDSL-type esterase/lipase family protein [Bacteroidota bacterium]
MTFILSVIICGVSYSQVKPSSRYIAGTTPVGFESEINDFLKQDSASFPPPGVVLFAGSSTIRKWSNLADDFKEIRVIRRGFGGSTMEALNYYMNDIVLPYSPAVIVVYEGDNDLAAGVTPDKLIARCDTFIARVHRRLPHTTIWFMSVKPSFARRHLIPSQAATNKGLKKLAGKRRRTKFIDITRVMYDASGKLRKDLFEPDSLHVNSECYRLWAAHMKKTMLSKQHGPTCNRKTSDLHEDKTQER